MSVSDRTVRRIDVLIPAVDEPLTLDRLLGVDKRLSRRPERPRRRAWKSPPLPLPAWSLRLVPVVENAKWGKRQRLGWKGKGYVSLSSTASDRVDLWSCSTPVAWKGRAGRRLGRDVYGNQQSKRSPSPSRTGRCRHGDRRCQRGKDGGRGQQYEAVGARAETRALTEDGAGPKR